MLSDELKMTRNVAMRNICAEIKHLCKSFKGRSAGSESERQAADYMAKRLESTADSVKREKFTVYPKAYMSWTVISVICAVLAYVSYFFSSLLTLAFFIVGTVPYVVEYAFCKRALDPIFKGTTSENVTAVKSCSKEPKKRIYFVANIDATPEWHLKYSIGTPTFQAIRSLNLIGVIYLIVLAIVRWCYVGAAGAGIAEGALLYAGLAGAIFLLPWIASLFFISKKEVVDGANDNLSGCAVALAALDAIKDVQLENTEVGVILTGSGAVGIRGAKAWCDAHANEVDKENTVFITLNTLRELAYLNVNTRELMWTIKNSPEVIELITSAAKDCNVKCSARIAPFIPATDSEAFSEVGLKSASIMAVNRKLPDYYHTRYDTADNISEECLGASYALVMSIIDRFSGEGKLSALYKEAEEAKVVIDTPEASEDVSDAEIKGEESVAE